MKSKENKAERVLVHLRMRPISEDEKLRDKINPIETFDTDNNFITVKKDYEKKTFFFDNLLEPNIAQVEVFEKTGKSVVDSVIKGYNGTIFAYGQTGTGKTFTMVGNFQEEANRGIIPRSFEYLLKSTKQDKEFKYNISISFIQIYLETIMDLLEPSNENIRIREDPDLGVYLEGVEWVKVTNLQECHLVFEAGEKNRATASTKMNAHSSRSHAIMIVKVEKSVNYSADKLREIQLNNNLTTDKSMTKSNLFLVDLAGSERVKKTRADAMRLEEAKKINFSLLVLGNCISALSDSKNSHVNYRDSKLTRLLQESLGGNAKTSLIVTISPAFYNIEETISALGFGQRAMKVQNKPLINKTVDYQALSIKLQEDLDLLNDQYTKIKIEYDKITEENKKFKNTDTYLELQKMSFLTNIDKLTSSASTSKQNIDEKCVFKLEGNLNKNRDVNEIKSIEIRTYYEEEMKKLETSFREVQLSKEAEHDRFIQEVDKILVEKETEIEEAKKEITSLTYQVKKLKTIISDYDKEKDDLQKTIFQMSSENEEINKNYENNMKHLKILEEENTKFKSKTWMEKEMITKFTETDNDSFNPNITEIAIKSKLMTDSENININIIERLIIFLDSEYKNSCKYLENKNADYLKLIKIQKEKDFDYENEIKALKDFNNSNNLKIEKYNLEEEMKEIKERLEKSQNEYIRDTEILKEQLSILNVNLNNTKINLNKLIEENNYKESIIDEKEKRIAQLLNQIADFETEIEQNQSQKKELKLLQNELFMAKKKLRENSNLEIELKAKINSLEGLLAKEISEKKKIIEETQVLIKENENLVRERDSMIIQKTGISSSFTDLENKLKDSENDIKEKLYKIKTLEDKILELSTNTKISNSTVESLNKKINDLETNIVLLNKAKDELSLNYENEIKLMKSSQDKEITNLKINNEKENDKLKSKNLSDLEYMKNSFIKQIENINLQNKVMNDKYSSLSSFLSNLFIFYEESDLLISTNQSTIKTMIEKFIDIKSNLNIIDNKLSEISIDEQNCNKQSKNVKKLNVDALSETYENIEEKSNYEKFKEKIARILNKSDEMLKFNLSFIDLDKIRRKNVKRNLNVKTSFGEDYLSLIDKIKFDNVMIKLNDFLNGLNTIHEGFYIFFNVMLKLIKSSQDFTQHFISSNLLSLNKEKNQSLEIELQKKNENYLKNAIIALNQSLADKVSTIVLNKEVEHSINMFQIFSNKKCNDLSSQEIYKFSKDFINDIMNQISNFIENKDIEIQNINEKIIYYLREIDLIKHSDKKDTNSSNIQIIKLQSQLKLKEDEIIRLNQRIEEHMKNIKALKEEVNKTINKNINLNTNNLIENNIKTNNDLLEASVSNKLVVKEKLTQKMSVYEEEINSLKSQITEQKQNFQLEKDELLKTKQMYDKLKKKDADTGKFLIKEYFSKTSDIMIDFYKAMNKSDGLFQK